MPSPRSALRLSPDDGCGRGFPLWPRAATAHRDRRLPYPSGAASRRVQSGSGFPHSLDNEPSSLRLIPCFHQLVRRQRAESGRRILQLTAVCLLSRVCKCGAQVLQLGFFNLVVVFPLHYHCLCEVNPIYKDADGFAYRLAEQLATLQLCFADCETVMVASD